MFSVTKAESLIHLFQVEMNIETSWCYWVTVVILGVFGYSQYCNSQVCSHHGNENGGLVKTGFRTLERCPSTDYKGKEDNWQEHGT